MLSIFLNAVVDDVRLATGGAPIPGPDNAFAARRAMARSSLFSDLAFGRNTNGTSLRNTAVDWRGHIYDTQ